MAKKAAKKATKKKVAKKATKKKVVKKAAKKTAAIWVGCRYCWF